MSLERLRTSLADRYRLERELGQGGMATVYLAQDLKHDRQVAIKVLKPELAAVLGAERFVVEIKTTAALQHPHILPLFDSGSVYGPDKSGPYLYYVMPFIQGETLRTKLDREHQFGVDEAVRITREVADALHYAHRHGVIHRDIKPENILLHDGRPMVADFGIALALSAAAGGRMTETGLSLGTPHYMSPEQATAEKEITGRSDVYSLASLLFEMLTGEPPHTGKSAQQIIMKIIAEPVKPVTQLRRSVPGHVAAAVAKALEKLPADRFDSAAEFSAALGNPGFTGATGMVAGLAAARGQRDWRLIGLSAALLVMTAIAAWAQSRPAPPQPVSRYSVRLSGGQQALAGAFGRLALTPDGSRLIYSAGGMGQFALWVRERDNLESALLPGTTGAQTPFVSPDGDRVAFLGRGLQVVSLSGGPAVTLTDSLVGGLGGSWSTDGYLYVDGAGPAPLVRVPATGGGAPTWFTQLDSTSGEVDHFFPEALPNGRGVLFTVGYTATGMSVVTWADRSIAVASTRTGAHRVLLKGVYVRYARSGHLVYVTADGTLMAVGFDQDAMELTGEPVALASGITLHSIGVPDLALAADGRLAYTVGGAGALTQPGIGEAVWVGRDGRTEPVAADWTRAATTLALSPGGGQLAASILDGGEVHLWVRDLVRETAYKLTFSGTLNHRPSWAPDGRAVLFVSDAKGEHELHARRSDGTAEADVLVRGRGIGIQEGFITPDGTWVVYRAGGGNSGDLYARRTSGDTTPVGLATTAFGEFAPAVSPDGRWLAYVATETARNEVYVRPFPQVADGKWLVSSAGGTEPVWSRDGKELFYRNAKGEMVAVEVLPTGTPPIGQQRVLFSATAYATDPFHRMYDVDRDGRFVMLRLSESQLEGEVQLIIVENFFEELRRRVPR